MLSNRYSHYGELLLFRSLLLKLLIVVLMLVSSTAFAKGYQEDFNDPDRAKEALFGALIPGQRGDWVAKVDHGRYTLENRGSPTEVRYMSVLPGNATWSDPGERISVEIGGDFPGDSYHSGAGLILRLDPDTGSYLAFVVLEDQTFGLYRRDEVSMGLVHSGADAAIRKGTNELSALIDEENEDVELFVNGEMVARYGLSWQKIEGKGVGLIAIGNGRFEFDNFSLPNAQITQVRSASSSVVAKNEVIPTPVGPAAIPEAVPLESKRLPSSLPSGFQTLSQASPTGQLVFRRSSSSDSSARQMIDRAFGQFTDFFDGRPTPIGAFGAHKDDEAWVVFSAKRGGVELLGIALAFLEGTDGFTALAFDSQKNSAETISSMMNRTQGLLPRRSALHWRWVSIPDGNGRLELPTGWRIEAAINSMVDIAGPDGSYVNLGIHSPVYTPEAARIYGQYPGSPRLTTARYSDPVTVVQELIPQLIPQSRVTRIIDYAPVDFPQGQAAYVHFRWRSARADKPFESLILSVMMPVPGGGQWTFYRSMIMAPTDRFEQNFPVLLRIWRSWKVSDRVFQARMDSAIKSMEEAGRIYREANRDRQASFERAAADWAEVLRDQTQMLDTQSGLYERVPNTRIDEIVSEMNRTAGYTRYQHIPLRDLQ